MKQEMTSRNTVKSSILEWRRQQRAMRKQAQKIITRDKWKYDNIKQHRNWIRLSKQKPIKIYIMDKLQQTIITKYEELEPNEQVKYLKESITWHREVAHYHMYMERNFSTQLQDHPGQNPEENTADSAPALAQPAEAEPQSATATKAE
jgi:Rps23 Pro-64 3,4-dihydroxylase Tpa1-like proline 4-hydroxylase